MAIKKKLSKDQIKEVLVEFHDLAKGLANGLTGSSHVGKTERISYERLFNLGGYEHEKFIVTKDVEEEDRLSCFKGLHNELVQFEKDLSVYRNDRKKLAELSFGGRVLYQKEIKFLRKRIKSFEDEHKPVEKACKCFYCTHPDYDENQDYDD